jgi:hypothetical protein
MACTKPDALNTVPGPLAGLASMVVFVEGQQAFDLGDARSDNPYSDDEAAAAAWDAGWLDGRDRPRRR